jgi:hypothetical protein
VLGQPGRLPQDLLGELGILVVAIAVVVWLVVLVRRN